MNVRPVDIPSLTRALEWIEDAVEVSSTDGFFVYVNPAWCRLTGYTAEEAIGRSPRSLLRAESWRPASYYDAIDAQLAQGLPYHGQIVSRKKDGTEMVNQLHITPTTDADGHARHVIVVRHDLTLQNEAARLRDVEARLERAIRGANDGLWELDFADKQVHLTDRCMELLGASERTVPLHELVGLLHPDDRARLGARVTAPSTANDVISEELRLLVPEGSERWLQLRARVYRDAEGKPERISGALTDIQAIKDAEAAALDAATRDAVTELPNRRVFVDRVQNAVARASRVDGPAFAILFIDLRKFKQVNDRLGHAVGDELLRAVAERLRATVRPGDTVARLGGDEFGVLLEPMANEAQVLATARRVERVLARDFQLGPRVVQIAGTVGAVLGDGKTDVDALIREADAAMYAAREGRVGHGLADLALRGRVHRRTMLERDLARALRRREVTVALQPIVGTLDRRPAGAEALVRWSHPELGPIPPMELLAVTDDLDLGAELGMLVLEKSVDWVAAARREGLLDDEFVLHVNANARQMGNSRFADCLRLVARGSGMPAGRLFVEITETVLVDRPDEMTELMHELIGAGLGFALDDFGTGWSSLSHLRRFPVHGLKIDRSFTAAVLSEPKPAEIVRGLVTMANALGITLVAEGVETEEEARAMAELGCAYAQGYLYARPLAPDDASAALRELRAFSGRR